MNLPRYSLATACAFAVLVAACSGGDGDATPSPTPPSAAVALLGDLVAPVDAMANPTDPLRALRDLLPPDGSASAPAEFPVNLLPPN